MTVVAFLMLLFGAPVWGYQSGAPPSACATLTPSHHGKQPQNGAPPYTITTALLGPGQSVKVTVSAGPGGSFQGFMVQGRSSAGSLEPLGTFCVVPSEAKASDCGSGTANTVTQRSSSSKSTLEFEWQPPADFRGSVVFEGTVLQDFSTFWSGVRSDKVDVVGSSGPAPQKPKVEHQEDHRLNVPSEGRYNSNNRIPPQIQAGERLISKGTSDPLAEGCDTTKVCFGVPQGCVGKSLCDALVTCLVQPEVAEFEMRATGSVYVAVGLSDDGKMGKDSVVECVRAVPGQKPDLFASWNVEAGKGNVRLPGSAQNYGVFLLSGSDVNGVISCKFRRQINTTIKGTEFCLGRDPQYILLASGSSADANGIGYHDVIKAGSSSAQLLSSGGVSLARDPKVLQRLHAALMLSAWVGAASVGILLARYFKQTWVGSQLCAKAHWFAWHQALMAATWLLTIIGFIVIFAEVQGWSGFDNAHPILGVITTALAFVQPLMAFLRPPPDSPTRPIFNWAHWTVGNLAHLLAVVTIFLATDLEDADLPRWFVCLLACFVVFYLLTHVLLTVAARSSAKKLSERANNDVQMSNLNGPNTPPTPTPVQLSDAPHSKLRKLVLGLFVAGNTSLTVALVVVAILGPIA